MGYYINPSDGSSKELWLNANGGVEVDADYAKAFKAEGSDRRIVCLVDNGLFTAAGIAFDDGERNYFAIPDGRHKRWYVVSVENLKPFWQP